MMEKKLKQAILFGATGLVGSELLNILLNSKEYSNVIAPTRKKIEISNKKLKYIVLENFKNLKDFPKIFQGTDLFYCIGSTRKKAGSNENFEKLELTLAENIFNQAAINKIQNVYLISSKGVTKNTLMPYLKTKWKVEEIARGFNYNKLCILRPSLLIGKRNESRFIEEVTQKSMLPFLNLLQKTVKTIAPVSAKDVAKKLYESSINEQMGEIIIENKDIIF
jgi:uncharacterized protein YbjT (DUF2867 family)